MPLAHATFDHSGSCPPHARTERASGNCCYGTTTLFAALNIATGEVIGKTYRKHRHQEVLRFLREVEKTVPKEQ